MATSSELIQLTGIGVGAIVALMTMMVGMFIWTTNYRDKSNYRQHQETRIRVDERHKETLEVVGELVERRHRETQESMERMRQETSRMFERYDEQNERRYREMQEAMERLRQETSQMFDRVGEQSDRRHQELLAAIRPLYHHVHNDDGQVIIPAEEVAPAPAD